MKKRVISIALTILLILAVLPISAQAVSSSMSNFRAVNTYYDGRFSDVPYSQWYAPYVEVAYEYGLINGKTATTFNPNDNLTIAEAIKLAVCLDSIYTDGQAFVSTTSPWYRGYVDYALYYGIITAEYPNYNAYATRAEFAQILAWALPYYELEAINTIYDGDIPDVYASHPFYEDVYLLYRAGVLTGSDSAGTFKPYSYITRAEVATIVTRMANPDYRQYLSLWSEPAMYDGYYPVIDFGVYFGVWEYDYWLDTYEAGYLYLLSDIPYTLDDIASIYADALERYADFYFYDSWYSTDGYAVYEYYNSYYDCSVVFGGYVDYGVDCYLINIYFY